MNQQVQPYEIVPAQPPSQVTPQQFQTVMGIIIAVWAGAWVLSQIVKMARGKEVEKPRVVP